jgi:hypothetical protein
LSHKEKRCLEGFLDLKGFKLHGVGENCIMSSFIIYNLTDIIRVMKSRRMIWVGQGWATNALKDLVGNTGGMKRLGSYMRRGRIILK